MTAFRVWAPVAQDVRLEVNGESHPLVKGARGYWEPRGVTLAHGQDYLLRVDGRGPFPDPRSPWQPYGVLGASRWVEHDKFVWKNNGFRAPPLAAALLYELHVGTFTEEGTFDAAVKRLAHLRDLGVTHVELLPVNEYPGSRGWGYDGVDLFAPHHAYGGPEGLKRFVDAAHGHGLAVLMDVVYNHFGPAGNFVGQFAPYFNESYKTPWGPAVNLDGMYSDEVRRFFCDNALTWLRDYRCDGLRLDAVHAYRDASAEPFLEQLAREVDALEARDGRPLVLIAESDLNDPRVVTPYAAGGLGVDAQWSDDYHHAIHALLTGEKAGYYADFGAFADVARALREVFVYAGRYAEARGRTHGRPVGALERWRFLGYAQNHDQIGNRAQGERLSQLVSRERSKIAAALVLAAPFTPMLFQGEEWGAATPFQYFTDHQDEGLARAVRDGRRSEFVAFGWKPEDVPDPQARATFERSRLDWRELERAEHRELLDWHRALVALRREGHGGGVDVAFNEDARWLTWRWGRLRVAFHLGDGEAWIDVEDGARMALRSGDHVEVDGAQVRIAGDGVAVMLVSS